MKLKLQSVRSRRRKLVAVLVSGVALATSAFSVVGVQTAAAGFATNSVISSNSGGANLRSCPYTWCSSLGYMRNGTAVGMMSYCDSQYVAPPQSNYGSSRWFKVGTYALGGSIGWVHSSLVARQTGVGYGCS
jgi:hypothetical protein